MIQKTESNKKLNNSAIEYNESFNKRSSSSLVSPKTELNKSYKVRKIVDKVNIRLNYDKSIKNIKPKNLFFKSKKNKQVNIHKYVNNNKINKNINNEKKINNNLKNKNYKKGEENFMTRSSPIINKNIYIEKKLNKSLENRYDNVNNNYSPINTNNTYEIPFTNIGIDYEDLKKKINKAIDNEIKELEKDEENIELLLEQLIDDDKFRNIKDN